MSDGEWRTSHKIVSDLIDMPLIKGKFPSDVRNKRMLIPTSNEVTWYLLKNKKYVEKNEKVREWKKKDILCTE